MDRTNLSPGMELRVQYLERLDRFMAENYAQPQAIRALNLLAEISGGETRFRDNLPSRLKGHNGGPAIEG